MKADVTESKKKSPDIAPSSFEHFHHLQMKMVSRPTTSSKTFIVSKLSLCFRAFHESIEGIHILTVHI